MDDMLICLICQLYKITLFLLKTSAIYTLIFLFDGHSLDCMFQIICGQNCTFVIQANGTVLACGEGSYGRLGQGNSDDLKSLTVISALQGEH